MTNRNATLQLTAQSNIDQVMGHITASIQQMGSASAAQIPKLAKELANAQTAATRAATATVQYEQALSGLHKQAANTAGGMGLLQGALSFASGGAILNVITAVGKGIVEVGTSALTMAGNLKQSRIGFELMLGGAQAANTELQELRKLANSTDLQFKPLQNAAQGLIAVGYNGQQALGTIRQIADTVAAYGKGQDEFNRIALAMEQVHSRGRLLGDDARQFESVGLPVWRVLGDYLHTSATHAQELSEAGKISAQTFESAFAQNASQFAGAAEKASHSFNGLLSTLGDIGQTLLTDIGGPITDSLEPILQTVVNTLSDPQVAAEIKKWGQAIGDTITQMGQLGQVVAQIFGLQLPQLTANTTTAATAAGAVRQQWNTIAVDMGDVKIQSQALKDSEDKIRDSAQATGRAYDEKLDRLRDQATLLDRSWEAEQKIAQLHKLDADIDKNRLLGKNIFSSAGRAAAIKAEEQGEQRTQLVKEMGHQKEKNALADQMTAVERAKKAADQAAQTQIAGIERTIKGIQREADAYDRYNKDKAAAIQALQQQQDQAVKAGQVAVGQFNQIAATIQTALGGKATETIGPFTGLLDQLKDKTSAVYDAWNDVAGAFNKAADSLGPLGDNLDGVINALGGQGGMAGALAVVSLEFERLMRSIANIAPNVLGEFGRTAQITSDQISQMAAATRLAVLDFRIERTGDNTPATLAEREQARAALTAANTAFDTHRAAWNDEKKGLDTNWNGGIAAINTDIDQRERESTTRIENQQAGRNMRSGGSLGQQEVVVTFDENTNMLKVLRSVLRNHPELLDVEAGAH